MKNFKLILIIIAISCSYESQNIESLIIFHWIPESDTIATLSVLPNYEVKHYFYGEGIITNLLYPDSSIIFLYIGGVVSLPFCRKPDCIEIEKHQIEDRLYRSGKHINSNLY